MNVHTSAEAWLNRCGCRVGCSDVGPSELRVEKGRDFIEKIAEIEVEGLNQHGPDTVAYLGR